MDKLPNEGHNAGIAKWDKIIFYTSGTKTQMFMTYENTRIYLYQKLYFVIVTETAEHWKKWNSG